jgi:hypothetical protein
MLPVEIAGPEAGGAPVDAGERGLNGGGDGGDPLGKPQSLTGTDLLSREQGDGRPNHERQDRVLPVPDQQIEHA